MGAASITPEGRGEAQTARPCPAGGLCHQMTYGLVYPHPDFGVRMIVYQIAKKALMATATVRMATAAAAGPGLASSPPLTASPGVSPASPSSTPYLDQVEGDLLQVSPGLKGTVWERTGGNHVDLDQARWLLQVPECW